jgi:hypothetical protein
MPLFPDAAQQGLWINPAVKRDEPGVFALIIGVSRYDYLADGAQPAQETYGLGQLGVSALTAYRFFEWLCDGYALGGWPVARVRLLLSPLKKGIGKATVDELEGCDSRVFNHTAEATFANCKSAIENWYAEMQSLATPAAGRSLFFFSGHGLELKQSHQVLLPCDYLRPPIGNFNDSISTRNLIDCVPLLQRIASHVLLIDACRNDFDKLRGRNIRGADILNDDVPGATSADCDRGVLYATASGRQAYQPKANGISLFGQALLDGLKTTPMPKLGEPPIELRPRGDTSAVEFNRLTSYMKGRVAALINAANEQIVQIVRGDVSSSDPGNRPIDLNEISKAAGGAVEEVFIDGTRRRSPTFRGSTLNYGGAPLPEPEVPVERRGAWLAERYTVRLGSPAPLTVGVDAGDQISHFRHIFGSEAITYPWFETLTVTGLSTRQAGDYSAVEIISTELGEQRTGLHRVQIHLRIGTFDPVGHLLAIRDEKGRNFACVLPNDRDRLPGIREENPVYQLEIDVGESDAGPGSFIRFSASLSPQNTTALVNAARIWERLRALNAVAAVELIQTSQATSNIDELSRVGASTRATVGQPEDFYRESERALAGKVDSPLGAAVAGLVLLKANRFGLMHDWTRNVGNWFPWIPDGVVLWTEQRLRMAPREPLPDGLGSWFVGKLRRRSLPFMAECLDMASDILRNIKRGRIETDEATRQEAATLGSRYDAVSDLVRDVGLFCTYAGWPYNLDLLELIGPPRFLDADSDAIAAEGQTSGPTKPFRSAE